MDMVPAFSIEINGKTLEGAELILEGAKNQRMTSELRMINLVV